MSTTMSHNACEYLPKRQLVLMDLKARLAEENILFAKVSMHFDTLSGGVVRNTLVFNWMVEACSTRISGEEC